MVARLGMFGVVLATALLAATVLLPGVAVWGWRPDVVALTVVAFGLADGPETGARYGFAAGVAGDLLSGADQPLGVGALVLLLVGYAAGQVRPYNPGTTATGQAMVGGVGAVLVAGALGLLAFLLDPERVIWSTVLQSMLVGGLYSAVVAPLVVGPVMALSRRVRATTVAGVGGLPSGGTPRHPPTHGR